LTTTEADPLRGEVWLVDLEPTVGDELNKTRRVVVTPATPIAVSG
jgi:mRNA-degrading endonuclease toxin of MazEF toxin-antitoxin module